MNAPTATTSTPATTACRRQRLAPSAFAAACVLSLAACGGGNDDDTAARLEVGDIYTVESVTEGGVATVRSFQVNGVSTQGELRPTASDDLVPGVLVPLPLEVDSAKFVNPDRFKPISPEALRRTYFKLVRAKAQPDGKLDIQAAVEEIADLDDDIASIHLDLERSGLTPAQYLEVYDTLDQVPAFASQDDAELQAMRFFDDVEEYELQGASCNTMSGTNWCDRAPSCDSESQEPWCGPPSATAAWIEALKAQGTHFAGFLGAMRARRDNFSALTAVYRSWRSQHPDAVMPRDFIAAYLKGEAALARATHAAADQANLRALQVGELACGQGKAFTFLENNAFVADVTKNSACFAGLAWRDIPPFVSGITTQGPSQTITIKKSGKNGDVLLASMRMVWQQRNVVEPGSPPAQKFTDFTPVVTAKVSDVFTAGDIRLSAYGSAVLDVDNDGLGFDIVLTTSLRQTGANLKNAPASGPHTRTLRYADGFRKR